jgi:hypothetical protein
MQKRIRGIYYAEAKIQKHSAKKPLLVSGFFALAPCAATVPTVIAGYAWDRLSALVWLFSCELAIPRSDRTARHLISE